MTDQQQEALDAIRYYVWSGHYHHDEVFDIIDDEAFESNGENDGWLRDAISREFDKKRDAKRSWPAVTKPDFI